ncbi:cilia- and flagella-associated protein 161 [Hemibagrus wyckioides]|nr:cilia- and flagella-associated protein 161 [Hemibagrus wyckioides]
MDPVRVYRPAVRLGNWREDVTLEEEALSEFLQRKDRGELTVQKTGVLRQNLLKPVSLSVSPDGSLRFGDPVMLVNSRGMKRDPCDPGVLSIIADFSNFTSHLKTNSKQFLQGPCQVGGASSRQPCVRNTFIITSVDECEDGEILRYEQNFALRTTPDFGAELYLASDHRTFQKCAKKSRLQEVSLVQQKDFLCWWKLLYFDPQERLEHEGFPVQVNTKLLLSHCKTNQCLAALPDHTLWTPFGKESEITAHTFLDSHKAEQESNHWIFMTSDLREEEPSRN